MVKTFDGSTFDQQLDGVRLTKQLEKVYDLMKNGTWWSLAQLAARTGAGTASMGARVRDFRKAKFGGFKVNRKHIGKGLHMYQLVAAKKKLGVVTGSATNLPSQPEAPKKLKNYVSVLLDASGSMRGIDQRAKEVVLDIIKATAAAAKSTGIETYLRLGTFGENISLKSAGEIKAFDPARFGYSARECQTRLYDAIGLEIEALKNVSDFNDPNVSFLVYVITDGHENASCSYSSSNIRLLIADAQSTNRFTFGFHVPPSGAGKLDGVVPPGNIRRWETTEKGIKEVGVETVTATRAYYDDRSKGAKASTTLFTTNMKNVTAKDVAMKLNDLSNQFKACEVPKEEGITEFVEKKTKKPYVIGQAYFLLQKKERIQKDKAILIQEKGKKAVWGGNEARKLLNMPDTAAVVTPGNHSDFDIYVQSASVNRILPRGTKILIDTTMTVPIKSTWDHVTAAEERKKKEDAAIAEAQAILDKAKVKATIAKAS
ncbi:MAG TPA: vWA domain-containing protein [Oculatellaceae cyanobacterium]